MKDSRCRNQRMILWDWVISEGLIWFTWLLLLLQSMWNRETACRTMAFSHTTLQLAPLLSPRVGAGVPKGVWCPLGWGLFHFVVQVLCVWSELGQRESWNHGITEVGKDL